MSAPRRSLRGWLADVPVGRFVDPTLDALVIAIGFLLGLAALFIAAHWAEASAPGGARPVGRQLRAPAVVVVPLPPRTVDRFELLPARQPEVSPPRDTRPRWV